MEQPLIDFLHYVERSDIENIPPQCDERLKHLHKKIQDIKSNEQMGVTYMKMEERDRLIREEGLTTGRKEGLTAGRKEGFSAGRNEGLEFGIKALLETCKDFGLSREQAFAKIQNQFSLSSEQTGSYMVKYWK